MDGKAFSNSFNMEKAAILLLDGDAMSMNILTQILSGFGARNIQKCPTVEAAKAIVQTRELDLIVVDPAMAGADADDFIPWLRRAGGVPNRYVPVLIATGHTQQSRIKAARDGGANFVIAKPLTPAIMLSRILWIAREKRPHVECKIYAGPDRRWKFDGPPAGESGRRDDDLSAEVGDASAPNMSQEDIDAMMQPRKVSL